MASCCETEESLNGRMRRISKAHKQTVTAGESKTSPGITEATKEFPQMVYNQRIPSNGLQLKYFATNYRKI